MTDPPVVRWYDFDRQAQLTCTSCGWCGTSWFAESENLWGSEAPSLGDCERLDCPQCGEVLLFVLEPTDEDTEAAAAAGNAEAAKSLRLTEQMDAAKTPEEKSRAVREAFWAWGLAPDDLAKAPTPLVCVECGREDPDGSGWKMARAGPDEVVAYCPGCWSRKFGESVSDA